MVNYTTICYYTQVYAYLHYDTLLLYTSLRSLYGQLHYNTVLYTSLRLFYAWLHYNTLLYTNRVNYTKLSSVT